MFTPSIWFFVLRAMATDRKRLRVLPYRRFLIGYGQPTFLHFWPVAWSYDRTFLLLAIQSVSQPLQVFCCSFGHHILFLKWFWLHFLLLMEVREDLRLPLCCGTISFRKVFTIVMYFVYYFPVRIAVNEFVDWNKEDSIAFLILFYDIITIDYISHFYLLIKWDFLFVGHVNHLVILAISTFSYRCDVPSKTPDITIFSLYRSHGNKSVCYFI